MFMPGRTVSSAGAWTRLGLFGIGVGLLLAAWATSRAEAPTDGTTATVRGTVQSFTTAPKGEVDGAVLDDGTVIHWPPHLGERFAAVVKQGDRIRAVGRREVAPKGETNFEVQTVTNLSTQATADVAGPARVGPERAPDR